MPSRTLPRPAETESPGVASLREGLPPRVWVWLGVLALELLGIAQFPHSHLAARQVLAAPIVFGSCLLFFGRKSLRRALLDRLPLDRGWLALHAIVLALIPLMGRLLLHSSKDRSVAAVASASLWYGSILLLAATLAAGLFSARTVTRVVVNLKGAWIFAALMTVAAMSARVGVDWLWDAPDSRVGHELQRAAFFGVKSLLSLFYARVVSMPGTAVLGTERFRVQIAGTCSGIEGLTLMLVLTVGWLVFARRELRLRRAIVLVPVALAVVWVLNMVRIAALIALGDAGHAQVALNGFHSEAGWILFNLVALGFLFAAQHLRWLRKDVPVDGATVEGRNVAAIYLLPFLAVLAASLITRAASSGFEWLYPLRFVVAMVVLWAYRSEYRRVDWRFGWVGPCAGVVTAGLWLAFAAWHRGPAVGASLGTAALLPRSGLRLAWLAVRVLAAVTTVPIFEELAFRGYLARRVMSPDIEAVPFGSLSLLAIAVSSAAFGLLHGRLWLPGMAAGVLLALVARWRSRLGEAVAAHVTANLLIAAWVLITGDVSAW